MTSQTCTCQIDQFIGPEDKKLSLVYESSVVYIYVTGIHAPNSSCVLCVLCVVASNSSVNWSVRQIYVCHFTVTVTVTVYLFYLCQNSTYNVRSRRYIFIQHSTIAQNGGQKNVLSCQPFSPLTYITFMFLYCFNSYTHTHTCIYIYIFVCVHTYIHVCTYIYTTMFASHVHDTHALIYAQVPLIMIMNQYGLFGPLLTSQEVSSESEKLGGQLCRIYGIPFARALNYGK